MSMFICLYVFSFFSNVCLLACGVFEVIYMLVRIFCTFLYIKNPPDPSSVPFDRFGRVVYDIDFHDRGREFESAMTH